MYIKYTFILCVLLVVSAISVIKKAQADTSTLKNPDVCVMFGAYSENVIVNKQQGISKVDVVNYVNSSTKDKTSGYYKLGLLMINDAYVQPTFLSVDYNMRQRDSFVSKWYSICLDIVDQNTPKDKQRDKDYIYIGLN